MIKQSHNTTTATCSGGSHDTPRSSSLGYYEADTTIGTVNDPQGMAEIHIDSPPFTEYEGSMNPANAKLKTIFLTIVLAAIYALIGLLLLGCETFTPKQPMPKPWNFPPAREWNQPLETSWQNAVDTFKRITSPRTKTIDGMQYEYDSVTDLYFPNLALYADWKDPEENP